MRRSLGGDEPRIPVFDAVADTPGSEVPDEPGVPGGRRRRGRGVGIAVAVLALLAGGVAIGGWLEAPVPSESPSPSASPALSMASPAPACVPAAANVVPSFEIRAVGTELGYGGKVGYTRRPGAETAGSGWQVPVFDPERPAPVIGSGVPLELYTSAGSCFRYIIAEYADATPIRAPTPVERRRLVDTNIDPPSPNPSLGALPDGDWVLRVLAYFETGVSGPDGLVIAEIYFRVQVGPGPFRNPYAEPSPMPTPLVTPAVACGLSPAIPEDVVLVMTSPGSEPVAGVPDGEEGPIVTIPVGELPSLAVTGDACARSWSIAILRPETGEAVSTDAVANLNDDPAWVAQNRWIVRPANLGTFVVVARLHFGPGVDVVRRWRIVVEGFTVPDTFLVAENGARVRALPGCGLTITLANGYSAGDSCGSIGYPEGLDVLRVPAWSRIALEIPSWTITYWTGTCGQVETDEFGVQSYNAPDGCSLGGYTVDATASPPAAAQFLARPGEFDLQLYVSASRNGDSYNVPMYARVAGE